MKIKKTNFKDLKIIEGKKFLDIRGCFREINKKKEIKKINFIFWCMSKSKKNVLRGLHLQIKEPQDKFISVVKGKILDVVVDLRKNSKTFGKHFKIELSEKNCKSLFIPKGFAHGFLALDSENIIFYGNSKYRSKKNEVGIIWNDKDLSINWPKRKLLISSKDKKNISFKDFKKKYLK
jgi:dTDP-4-dehydrorhamnose 3,5-epimerase